MSRQNVLLIAPSYAEVTGGVENLMQKIVGMSSFSFRVITEDASAGPECTTMRVKRLSGFIQTTRYILRHRRSIDLVYVSTARLLHLLLIPYLFGMGTICHAHGRDLFSSVESVQTALRTAAASLARFAGVRFIAVSDWTKTQLLSMGAAPDRVHLVPNGVDVERFQTEVPSEEVRRVRHKYGATDEDFLLLTVARLDPRKGHRLVIEALQHLEDCKYVVVGRGEAESFLRQLATEYGVEDRVRFAGFVPDVDLPCVYQACDLFVMPSEHMDGGQNVEGFGISFLEANASGKAVVGTRTGGIPTAIRHGETGLLCDPSTEAVSRAIRRMKDHPSFREACERQAKGWADEHEWRCVIDQLDRVIEQELESVHR